MRISIKTLDRYLLSSIGVATAMGVSLLSLVLVLGNVFKQLLDLLVNQHAPLSMVFAFISFVLPFSMTFTIPWGFLAALLLVFGRLSADNEILALRALGVSFRQIATPVLLLALFLSGICLWINLDLAPRSEQAMMDTLFKIATDDPSAFFQGDEVGDAFPDRRIYVGAKKGNQLQNILIFELGQGHLSRLLFAKKGALIPDREHAQLLLKVENAVFEERDPQDPMNLHKIHQGITLQSGVFTMSLAKLFQSKSRQRHINSYRLSELLSLLKQGGKDHLEILVELNKRFSISFAAFAFALIAIPLGITAHRKETSVGFGLSLVVAFTYFFFIIISDAFRSNPHAFPVLLTWLPNFIFVGLGGFLMQRLAKQ